MIPDPLDAFRRAADRVLHQMERAFVEQALALPGLLVDEAGRAVKKAMVDKA